MPRLTRSTLALVAALGLAQPRLLEPTLAHASVQTACPAASEPTRRVLLRFLTSADGLPVRQQAGFGHVSAANVRLLTDATDAAVCQKLRSGLTFNDGIPRVYSFYESDGYYFVSTVRPPPTDGRIRLGFNPLVVLTRDFQVVGAYTS